MSLSSYSDHRDDDVVRLDKLPNNNNYNEMDSEVSLSLGVYSEVI
jgi:hypothetical protein